jgi:hypothetical protein
MDGWMDGQTHENDHTINCFALSFMREALGTSEPILWLLSGSQDAWGFIFKISMKNN